MAIEKPWEVVEDPTKDFEPGVRFNHAEFTDTLRRGYWPNGMIFKNIRTHAKVKILGKSFQFIGRKHTVITLR